ncbi:hypothetical protein CCR75_001600 [Bremia lactucae]|uniref:Uncharacterized protein n=1 Tax=Bremia lactucae TaxID=4779 RepID=A0A976ICF0_BRELC|nr:hypothetical protein CCR75_001600 [Bremia lactucae]
MDKPTLVLNREYQTSHGRSQAFVKAFDNRLPSVVEMPLCRALWWLMWKVAWRSLGIIGRCKNIKNRIPTEKYHIAWRPSHDRGIYA